MIILNNNKYFYNFKGKLSYYIFYSAICKRIEIIYKRRHNDLNNYFLLKKELYIYIFR